ncbi:hypothetical protein PIB30_112708, partial [Stylosanthes scabra]|nr:hypothetical protein [Stylosanthes scabra]
MKVNGMKFQTNGNSRGRTTDNTGVYLKGDAGQGECDWYGILNEILELEEGGSVVGRQARRGRQCKFQEAFLAELNRLQAERQALIEAGCPEPPPIDEGALWTRFAGGRKRGRIYGMGVVPSHQHPPLFPDDEDADTASAPDLRERVVMLNWEISQQAEANARRVAALESTVQSQSQEVSDLRK